MTVLSEIQGLGFTFCARHAKDNRPELGGWKWIPKPRQLKPRAPEMAGCPRCFHCNYQLESSLEMS